MVAVLQASKVDDDLVYEWYKYVQNDIQGVLNEAEHRILEIEQQ